MSTLCRRGSRESGWNWSRPPAGPGRPPPSPPPPSPPSPPPRLPLAGAALLFVAIAAALLAVCFSDSDSATPPPTTTPVATTTPTPTREPSPAPSPTPSPTPTAAIEPDFTLEIWAGGAWQADVPAGPASFREGKAIPFLLRIERARPGDSYGITLRYTCHTLQFLSGYDRDGGNGPALAPGGPKTVVPDSVAQLPDDPGTTADDGENGRLSLWGGSFGPVRLSDVSGPCSYGRSLDVSLLAGRETLFLLWGAVVAPGAAEAGLPLRVTAFTDRGEQRIEIDPAAVTPTP